MRLSKNKTPHWCEVSGPGLFGYLSGHLLIYQGARWVSNPQPPHPQCGALPLSYWHHIGLNSIMKVNRFQEINLGVFGNLWGTAPQVPKDPIN